MKKVPYTGGKAFSTSNEVRAYIREIFGPDIEIVEATSPLRIQPTPADLVGATPRDPSNCVFVHTVDRMYGSKMVVVFKKVAYVDLIDKHGTRQVNRFMVSKEATKMLSEFDRGKPFEIGTAIEFLPPSKRGTLKVKRRQSRKRHIENKKYEDRRTRLNALLLKRRKVAEAATARLQKAKVKANVKKDKAMLAGIKQRKTAADAAFKATQKKLAAMDHSRRKRTPKTFDLTTRNGAIGNYNFLGKDQPPAPQVA